MLVGEDGANLVARSSPIAFIAREKYWVNNHAHILRQNRNANIRFLEYFLLQIDLKPYVTGSAQPKLTRGNLWFSTTITFKPFFKVKVSGFLTLIVGAGPGFG